MEYAGFMRGLKPPPPSVPTCLRIEFFRACEAGTVQTGSRTLQIEPPRTGMSAENDPHCPQLAQG
jgi:hypothetical protein